MSCVYRIIIKKNTFWILPLVVDILLGLVSQVPGFILVSSLLPPTAYWDATRAFMILSLLACFIGIVIGVMAFIHYSSFDGFDKTFAAGILFFISCKLLRLSYCVCKPLWCSKDLFQLHLMTVSLVQASLCCWPWLSTQEWQWTTMVNAMAAGDSPGPI